MASSNRFTLGGFTINYCKFYKMLEVITEKDGMEGGCRWVLPGSSVYLKLSDRLNGTENPIRISGGFCNFGQRCPSCRMTSGKQCEQIPRCQKTDGYFVNKCFLYGDIQRTLTQDDGKCAKIYIPTLSSSCTQTGKVR